MPPPADATLRTFGVANRSTNTSTPRAFKGADSRTTWSTRTATKRESEPASTKETANDDVLLAPSEAA